MVACFCFFNANLGDYPLVSLVVSSRASRSVVGFLYALAYSRKVSVSVRKPLAYVDVAEHFFERSVWPFVALFKVQARLVFIRLVVDRLLHKAV